MRQLFFGMHRANEIIRQRTIAAHMQNGSQIEHNCKLGHSAGAGPAELMAIDILVPLPETTSGNQQVDATINHRSSPTHAIPSKEIKSMHPETKVLRAWIVLYGILNYALINIYPQWFSQLVAALCLS